MILQICGGCHDDANDPGFEFEVQAKIDRLRHGTIEAGTGKPKSAESAARLPTSAVSAALETALREAPAPTQRALREAPAPSERERPAGS